jgi:WD40 repeat protein
MSPDGAWAAVKRERSGTLQFYDLKTGQPLGKIVGPEHSFFGRVLQVNGLAWNAAGDKVFLACSTRNYFHAEAPKNPGTPDMLDTTGAFNPRTGELLYSFETPNEKIMDSTQDLDYYAPEDLVYVAGSGFFGLWKGADGKFVREIDKPGPHARFTPDGSRLVSPDGVVDVKTGKSLRSFTFAKTRVAGPTGARIAAYDEDQVLRIHDAATGAEVARRDLSSARLFGKILSVAWHPAETQITVILDKQPAVLQVDFPEFAKGGEGAAARVRELRAKNAGAAPIKAEWK